MTASLFLPPSPSKICLVQPALVDVNHSVIVLEQLQNFLRIERPDNETSRSICFESLMRNGGVTHVEILLQNLSNKGVADPKAMLVFDGPSHLRSGPYSFFLLLANSITGQL